MVKAAFLVAIPGVLLLTGCAPPDQRVLDVCRDTAAVEARGHDLISSDIGELIEACMLSKGYVLEEATKRCGENLQTATDRRCYYRDTLLGHIFARLDR
jgi:hypothetical protein